MKKPRWEETEKGDRHIASEDRTGNVPIDDMGLDARIGFPWGLAKAILQMEMEPCSETGRYAISAWPCKCDIRNPGENEHRSTRIWCLGNWVQQHTIYTEQEYSAMHTGLNDLEICCTWAIFLLFMTPAVALGEWYRDKSAEMAMGTQSIMEGRLSKGGSLLWHCSL